MDGPKSLDYYLGVFRNGSVSSHSTRCASREREAMFAYIDSWNSAWRDMVRSFALSLPPMSPEIRVAALAPARNEQFRIKLFLNAIKSDIDSSNIKNAFELLIIENGVESEIGRTSEVVTGWIQIVNPSFPVHIIQQKWDHDEKYPLAKARKLIADIAIYRASRLTAPKKSLYFLTEDADIESIQNGRLKAAISYLDKHPEIDAIRGIQERSIQALKSNHLALLERRSWQITELLLSSQYYWPNKRESYNFYWNRVVTSGSNVFISAEVYCEIRGYSKDVTVFEDMDIGQRISVLRGRYSRGQFIPCMDTVRRFSFREESSIARILLSLQKGRHVYSHNGRCFYDADDIVKAPLAVKRLLVELGPYSKLTLKSKWRYERVLSELFNEVWRILKEYRVAEDLFKRMMFFIGFKMDDYYISKDGDITLVKTKNFLRLAEDFSKRR